MRRLAPLAALAFLAACQATPDVVQGPSRPGDDSALSTMERVAVAAQKCWFAAGDPAFKGLAMSPELTSHSGNPRILAVPRGNVGGLPKLVVEARGNPAQVAAYGPLMAGPDAGRISADVSRWSRGSTACTA
ncbi:MAG: hypothetical protein KF849_04340 [Rhizobiaceae bacterium]|nr:hypothetical protein [Rhizobiaceae bacterium]